MKRRADHGCLILYVSHESSKPSHAFMLVDSKAYREGEYDELEFEEEFQDDEEGIARIGDDAGDEEENRQMEVNVISMLASREGA
jgi:hypothetical protein